VVARPEVLALIPARGGSKSVPRKNIRNLAGFPLVAYSIAAARRTPGVGRVIVSTDDEQIAAVARQYGAETPFLRPAELATDTAPDLPLFVHALEWLARHQDYRPEIVVHLRPTTPLVTAELVHTGIRLLEEHPEADSVRMVSPPLQNPFKMWLQAADGFLQPLVPTDIPEAYNQPRQKLPAVLWQNGMDIIRSRTILELHSMTGRRIYPLLNTNENWGAWIDIDTETTLQIAEWLIRHGSIRLESPADLTPAP
jgi:N-acylneuraminate cytidylyltransferase